VNVEDVSIQDTAKAKAFASIVYVSVAQQYQIGMRFILKRPLETGIDFH
jgi:hypothetical protein